ncbi:MAG: GNAT family N-acetyltransferase [Pseudomonadota bacterium]
MKIDFLASPLSADEQRVVSDGFKAHSNEHRAPMYAKHPFKWLVKDDRQALKAALTADVLWDWMYVDELWVDADWRGRGVARALMQEAESFARSEHLSGLWLWTQSWQAADFYKKLGYVEFTRFENFPKGHARIGFRKQLECSDTDA